VLAKETAVTQQQVEAMVVVVVMGANDSDAAVGDDNGRW
jgi:hypothetical protein